MFIRSIKNRPIKIRLIILFLPIIILAVLITAIFSYINAKNQIEANARLQLDDTVYQTTFLLNEKLKYALEQLLLIENNLFFKNLLLSGDENSPEAEDINKINNLCEEIYSKNFEMLDSIYLNVNNTEFILPKTDTPIHEPLDIKQWFIQNNYPGYRYYWKMGNESTIFRINDPQEVFSVYRVLGSIGSGIKSLLMLNINIDYILEMLSNVKISLNGYLMLIDNEGNTISKNVPNEFRLNQKGLDFLKNNSGNRGTFNAYSVADQKLFVVFNTIRVNRWVAAAIIPLDDIFVNLSYIKYMILTMAVVLLIISTLVATFTANSISKPLSFLSTQVKRFEKGEMGVDFHVDDSSEIGVLANGLSSLRANVLLLLNRVTAEVEEKKQLELIALQEQINPHFTYNTLSSIMYLVDMDENKKASKMLKALTDFLMIGLSNGKEIISIKEELQHVTDYLFIQKMRYTKDFDFEINVDEDISNCKIIKLTLQPLVENSIYHGLRSKGDFGYIRINGSRVGNQVVLEVFDNGVGIPKEKLEDLIELIRKRNAEETTGAFGLRNVNLRLMLHFGEEYGLEIESEANNYTLIRVRIPFAYNDTDPRGGCD